MVCSLGVLVFTQEVEATIIVVNTVMDPKINQNIMDQNITDQTKMDQTKMDRNIVISVQYEDTEHRTVGIMAETLV